MIENHWNPIVDVHALMTPAEHCLALSLGMCQPDVVRQLEAESFDDAPVRDRSGRLVGVVATADARRLFERGTALRSSDIHKSVVSTMVSLHTLLATLADTRCALVRDPNRRCIGLTATSDLNRHEFRIVVFDVLARLEARLGALLEWAFRGRDQWDWIKLLGPNNRAFVAGYWEIAKRDGVDIGPVVALTLSEITRVISKLPGVLAELGMTKKEFEKRLSGVHELRNEIMHPVRPRIVGIRDARQLLDIMEGSAQVGGRSEDHLEGARSSVA